MEVPQQARPAVKWAKGRGTAFSVVYALSNVWRDFHARPNSLSFQYG